MTKIIDLGKDIISPVTGVITEERLMEALNDGLLDRLSELVSQGINHAQLVEAINNGAIIEDFWGGAESPVAILEEDVPVEFPNSQKVEMEEETYEEEECSFDEETGEEVCVMVEKTRLVPVLDDEGEPVMVQKLWKEYCTNYRISIDETTVCFKVGYTDTHGNLLHKVTNDELRLWITQFNIDNIIVYKDWKTLIKSDKYTNQEGDEL